MDRLGLLDWLRHLRLVRPPRCGCSAPYASYRRRDALARHWCRCSAGTCSVCCAWRVALLPYRDWEPRGDELWRARWLTGDLIGYWRTDPAAADAAPAAQSRDSAQQPVAGPGEDPAAALRRLVRLRVVGAGQRGQQRRHHLALTADRRRSGRRAARPAGPRAAFALAGASSGVGGLGERRVRHDRQARARLGQRLQGLLAPQRRARRSAARGCEQRDDLGERLGLGLALRVDRPQRVVAGPLLAFAGVRVPDQRGRRR